MKRNEKFFWLVMAGLFVVGFLGLIPAHGEICKEAEKSQQEACTTYSLVPFLVIKVGKALDALGVAITAIATIFIAWFTLSLRRSTDKLWDAGERQLKMVGEGAAQQALDTQASIAHASRMAGAAEESAVAARMRVNIAEGYNKKVERPYIIPTDISQIQPSGTIVGSIPQRAHITLKVGNYGRTPALLHVVRIAFQFGEEDKIPEIKNIEGSESHNAGTAMAAGFLSEDAVYPIPEQIELTENFGWIEPKAGIGRALYFLLNVRFEDMDGIVREGVSTWKYDKISHWFLRCGGKQHNYETEIET